MVYAIREHTFHLFVRLMILRDAILAFLEHAEIAKNQSLKTVINYRHYLRRFEQFAGTQTAIETIDLNTVAKFRLHLNRHEDKNGRTLSRKTQNYHLIALRAFFKYLTRQDYQVLAPEKIDLMKQEDREVSFLTREELETMLESIDTDQLTGLRNRALIEMLYSTGLRVSEIVSLNRDQVNLKTGEFMVRGKGRKTRIVFLSERARTWLEKYMNERKDLSPAIFINFKKRKNDAVSDKGTRLSTVSVETIVRSAARMAGLVKKVTPHTIRHTFATQLLFAGADIRSVQEMLGHASITTTQIYTHVTNQKLKEVHDKYHK